MLNNVKLDNKNFMPKSKSDNAQIVSKTDLVETNNKQILFGT